MAEEVGCDGTLEEIRKGHIKERRNKMAFLESE